jgi:phospholipid-binding lipoprotein MlaA
MAFADTCLSGQSSVINPDGLVRIAAATRGVVCRVAALLLAAVPVGCATPPSDPAARAAYVQNNDPLEPLNRKTLALNLFIDRILLKPVTKVYITVLPTDMRDAIRHVLDNMKEPVFFINNVLQGEPKRAIITVGRFTLNSTFGVAGVFDIAAKSWKLPQQKADFGQTLFVWGLPNGPYLILPLLGPSNPRDGAGMGIDAYIDPFSYLATKEDIDGLQIGRFVLDGIDERAQNIDTLDDLQKNSLDFYAALRSLAQQHRNAELRHGAAPAPSSNFYDDPSGSPAKPPASGSARP